MTVTLDEVIDRQIDLGYKDPREIFAAVEREVGSGLLDLVMPHIEEFIAELARQRLNSARRSAVAKITPMTIATREIMLKSIWIPSEDRGIEYKAIGKVTADEWDARAAYMERMIAGIAAHAEWCRLCAAEIRKTGVSVTSELPSLPPLPESDSLLSLPRAS